MRCLNRATFVVYFFDRSNKHGVWWCVFSSSVSGMQQFLPACVAFTVNGLQLITLEGLYNMAPLCFFHSELEEAFLSLPHPCQRVSLLSVDFVVIVVCLVTVLLLHMYLRYLRTTATCFGARSYEVVANGVVYKKCEGADWRGRREGGGERRSRYVIQRRRLTARESCGAEGGGAFFGIITSLTSLSLWLV